MRSLGCSGIFTILFGIVLGFSASRQTTFDTLSPISTLPPTPEFFEIVWSTQEIPCGTMITEDMVALIPTPTDSLPISPTPYLEWVVGKYTPQDIPSDVPVFYNSLLDTPVTC
jgi:hypothetical protein